MEVRSNSPRSLFFIMLPDKFNIILELLGKLHWTVAISQNRWAFKSLMDEQNEERRGRFTESAFAYHIHQYADVYTSKPGNFLLYPAEAWLHVPNDIKIMPHHLKDMWFHLDGLPAG
ncbi:hypothetical protein SAY86_013861 [Trapa natans]|uniref:Uncharacterized protein n=1 Tax=Trapa natans TaxID=22666 RepID=A0AAN7KZH6_TRANT|nr:hypothetical protein SAY86_013861 [Trapa natans]